MRICVAGMHRSGTSITAYVLSQLGVDLGPEETLLGPDAVDNPLGYWEQRGIIEVNDAVLERLGGPWTDPPRLRPGWATSTDLDDLRERARALLRSSFGDRPSAWKDPRCSLTLPFWLSVEPSLRVVICVRDPLEVAASWARRGPGFDEPFALELWMEHTARALIDSEQIPRLVVHHEDFFRDLDAQVRRLASFVDAEPASADTVAAIRGFVSESLWRSRTGTQDRRRVPPEVARLYGALRAHDPSRTSGVDTLSPLARQLLASRHRAQNRDVFGYRWPRLRERARRRFLKPFLWWVRDMLFAGRNTAASRRAARLERRIGVMIGALDRRRKQWRVE
jgi:hypothetical protein